MHKLNTKAVLTSLFAILKTATIADSSQLK